MTPETIELVRGMDLPTLTQFWSGYEAASVKRQKTKVPAVRDLCQNDLFYLLVRVCKREDMLHPWIYARVREVEKDPNGYLDLWAREHYKSSIITFGMNIQRILKDPEITIGIFSHTRPIAKAFLRQIMRELETNVILHGSFPDILWGKNMKDAPKWSEDEGIIVKRRTNPNEATIEAWGVVDGQPTSKHFKHLHFDDIVVRDSVTNDEMKQKTMSQLELSYNLGSVGGSMAFAGTKWDFNDAYKVILERGTVKLRFHPGREGGQEDGTPVYWDEKTHWQKRRDMGPYAYAAQILLNPKADALQGFRREWMRHYKSITPPQAKRMNKYILVDSANEKKKESDYTAMWVLGLGTDGNFYALDIVRDRLNLNERTDRLFTLYDRWKPITQVRWEKYGMMADIQNIKNEQEKRNYRFDVAEVAGITKKDDRISRLIPPFFQGKFYFPEKLYTTNWEKTTVDLVRIFIEEEFFPFPVSLHKDMLDSLSRIMEPEMSLIWPKEKVVVPEPVVQYSRSRSNAWMA